MVRVQVRRFNLIYLRLYGEFISRDQDSNFNKVRLHSEWVSRNHPTIEYQGSNPDEVNLKRLFYFYV